VICGGGAIGAAIAYFLSLRGARPIVIERYEVAGAASGKSGGFLALDWCRGSSLDRLARRSFELHAQLSSGLGDPWGYRRLTTYGGYAAEDDTGPFAAGGLPGVGPLFQQWGPLGGGLSIHPAPYAPDQSADRRART
jgi:glycine/D-amino acid oxidase-like deaminating enzyme